MKKTMLVFTLVLLGVGLFFYPAMASYFSDKNASEAVQAYAEAVNQLDQEFIREEFAKAREYNSALSGEAICDPFIPESGIVLSENYSNILNVDGILGYISIPKINLNLPVYHGSSEDTLQKGVGHLEGSSLPVGGPGTHAVLTGHRGLTYARMFTDLVELSEGDAFYVHVLDDTLAYRVDQVKVADPSDTTDLQLVNDEDYVTLVTCTPYGVNSHRLLVRGERIAYTPEAEEYAKETGTMTGWTQEDRILFIAATSTAGVMLILILIVVILRIRRNREES